VEEHKVSMGGKKLCNFRFADDIDLIAGSLEELAELTTRLDLASAKYGMEIRAEKSKNLLMGVNMQTNPDISIGT